MSDRASRFVPVRAPVRRRWGRAPVGVSKPGPLRLPALAIAALALASCGTGDDAPATQPAVRPVKLITVGTDAAAEARTYSAVVAASRSLELTFQVSGLIEELPVQTARRIDEGALVARLDQRTFLSDAASAQAQFDSADDEYRRAARLAETGVIAENALVQLRSQRDVARARLETAEKALGDTELRAPFSGVLADVAVNRLEPVRAGDPVAVLIDRSEFTATVDLPARIVAQAPTSGERGAFVTLDAVPGLRLPAAFREASLVADAAAQTYAVGFAFEPPEDVLVLPGMSATVEIAAAGDGADARVAVPLAALSSDGDGRYVWVVDDATMTVSRRDVTLREGIGELMIVADGLEAGETIVGAGAAHLREGAKVRPWTP